MFSSQKIRDHTHNTAWKTLHAHNIIHHWDKQMLELPPPRTLHRQETGLSSSTPGASRARKPMQKTQTTPRIAASQFVTPWKSCHASELTSCLCTPKRASVTLNRRRPRIKSMAHSFTVLFSHVIGRSLQRRRYILEMKRFAVLMCEDLPQWQFLGQRISNCMGDSDEIWDTFCVYAQELPDLQSIDQYQVR